jgi:Yip1 domain
MTDTTTPSTPGPSLLSRFFGILFSPRATYEKVVANPRALGAMALVALLSAVTVGTFMSSEVGKAAIMEQALKGPDPQRAQEAMEKILPYMGPTYAIFSFVFVPISTVVMSAILYMIFNVIMGGTANFRQMMAVVAHSQFVPVISAIFGTIINYSRGTIASVTTLAGAASMLDESSFLYRFLSAIELFNVWWVFVLSIGLAVLYRKKTSSVAITLFSIYGVVALVIAYFRSR